MSNLHRVTNSEESQPDQSWDSGSVLSLGWILLPIAIWADGGLSYRRSVSPRKWPNIWQQYQRREFVLGSYSLSFFSLNSLKKCWTEVGPARVKASVMTHSLRTRSGFITCLTSPVWAGLDQLKAVGEWWITWANRWHVMMQLANINLRLHTE